MPILQGGPRPGGGLTALDFTDSLYEDRNEGNLSDSQLRRLYEVGGISKLTYDLIRRLPVK